MPGIVARRRLAALLRCHSRIWRSRRGDIAFETCDLVYQRNERAAGKDRQAILIFVRHESHELGKRFGTLRGDKAELVEMPAQGVDERRALPDKEGCAPGCSMSTLCCSTVLTGTKRMPGRVTASQMAAGIRGIVILPADVGLDVRRRDEPNLMAELRQQPRPMVRACTGLQADETRLEASKEAGDVLAPQPLRHNHASGAVGAMDMKNVLGEIETNSADRGEIDVRLGHGRCSFEGESSTIAILARVLR